MSSNPPIHESKEPLTSPSSSLPESDDTTTGEDMADRPRHQDELKNSPSPSPTVVASIDTASKRRRTGILPPYIVVTSGSSTDTKSQSLCGRVGVAAMGYKEFAKATFHMFILHSAKAPPRKLRLFKKSDRTIFMQVYNYLRADYLSRARFRPRFASSGSDRHDEEYFLQPIGWREMVLSVVSIRVDYKLPEAYPGKEELRRIRGQDLGT